MKLSLKLLASVFLVVIMVLGTISFLTPPSSIGGEDWPLPPEGYPIENLTSNLNVTGVQFLGGQPIPSLGPGLDFPLGSQAFYYIGSYGNNTLLGFVIAQLPSQSDVNRFAALVISRLKENIPEERIKYLAGSNGGYFNATDVNRTIQVWYGRGWLFIVQVNGDVATAREAIRAIKDAIIRAYSS